MIGDLVDPSLVQKVLSFVGKADGGEHLLMKLMVGRAALESGFITACDKYIQRFTALDDSSENEEGDPIPMSADRKGWAQMVFGDFAASYKSYLVDLLSFFRSGGLKNKVKVKIPVSSLTNQAVEDMLDPVIVKAIRAIANNVVEEDNPTAAAARMLKGFSDPLLIAIQSSNPSAHVDIYDTSNIAQSKVVSPHGDAIRYVALRHRDNTPGARPVHSPFIVPPRFMGGDFVVASLENDVLNSPLIFDSAIVYADGAVVTHVNGETDRILTASASDNSLDASDLGNLDSTDSPYVQLNGSRWLQDAGAQWYWDLTDKSVARMMYIKKGQCSFKRLESDPILITINNGSVFGLSDGNENPSTATNSWTSYNKFRGGMLAYTDVTSDGNTEDEMLTIEPRKRFNEPVRDFPYRSPSVIAPHYRTSHNRFLEQTPENNYCDNYIAIRNLIEKIHSDGLSVTSKAAQVGIGNLKSVSGFETPFSNGTDGAINWMRPTDEDGKENYLLVEVDQPLIPAAIADIAKEVLAMAAQLALIGITPPIPIDELAGLVSDLVSD